MIIPHSQLDPETLQNLLEEYATRDGTDYGEREMSLESKVANLRRQLESKVVVIWFEPGEESVNLILAEDIPRDFPGHGEAP
ncbi:YheU family protein [uncultured Microbulbifer sp.]|uniref:YheU family protein n=1 Tax=uncultured Microbulbifer sp. TaxID=348147 RepID=UPI0026171BEB|nr:YheU family protein [uncultured Microbulbifer sp.]